MKIDFTQKLHKLNGEHLLEIVLDEEGKQKLGGVLTLSTVAITALHNRYTDEKNLPVKEKYERGEIASRIFNSGPNGLDLSTDEIALIKKLIGKRFDVLVVWQTEPLLENKEPKIKPKPKNDSEIAQTLGNYEQN